MSEEAINATAHRRPRPRRLRRRVELDGVIERLQSAGIQVTAPPIRCAASLTTPRTSPASSSRFPGPVLAVGHSYGGAVISNAAPDSTTSSGSSSSPRSPPTRASAWARWPRLPRQRPGDRAGRAAVPRRGRRGNGHRVRDRSREAPRRVRRRPAARRRPRDGRDPAAGRRAGLHRAVRAARLEVAAVLDRRRAPDKAAGTARSGRWPSAPGPRSPRSRART